MKQTRQEATEDKQALFKLMRATKERIDYRPELKPTIPTIVIRAKRIYYCLFMANEVAKAIPGQSVDYPHVGHTLNLEAVPQMVAIIKDFKTIKSIADYF